MQKAQPAAVLAAFLLGIASPLACAWVGTPEPDAAWGLAQVWFHGLTAHVDGWVVPEPGITLALAMVVFILQYLALFSVLLWTAASMRRALGRKAMHSIAG